MRITDDRYRRDQERLDLAMRLIRHEARTATIRTWTGLTADRIRKLHRQYVHDADALAKRHRGKPPRQAVFFLRNAGLRKQASALGGLYALFGLLQSAESTSSKGGSPPWVDLFCDAFETYLALGLGSDITFEHAAYLLEALRRGADLRPGSCPVCRAFTIIDTQRRMAPHCPLCEESKARRDNGVGSSTPRGKCRRKRRARIDTDHAQATATAPRLRRRLSRP